MILLTAIKDPFNPYESREVTEISFEGKSVEEYICELYPDGIEGFEIVASINGKVLEDNSVIPADGDNVVFCLSPEGSDVLRMIAMLALIVISIYAPYAAPAAWGLTTAGGALTVYGAMVSGAIMVGGSILVNAILPPAMPDTGADEQSTTYSWSATSNLSMEGGAAPIIYGKTKIIPPLIGRYIRPESEGGDYQSINLLYCLSDHQINDVTDIKINSNDIANYTNTNTEIRYGLDDQTVLQFFDDTYTELAVGKKVKVAPQAVGAIKADIPGTENTAIGVSILYPKGIGHFTEDGSLGGTSVYYFLQYKLKSDPDVDENWKWFPEEINYSGGFGYHPTRWTTSAYRSYFKATGLTAGEYEIRAWFNDPLPTDTKYLNDVYIEYVDGIVTDDFTYPGTGLLAVRALATDQLSGSMPTVSCVVERTYVDVYDTTVSSWVSKNANNPAWACYDILQNDRYGGGVDYTRINYSEFKTWADFCDTNSYTCNIVIDSTMSFAEALNRVSMLGRGHIIQRGTNFGVIIDKERSAVQMFGTGNIIEDSFKLSYLPKKNRANAISVSYFDEDADYDKKTFELRYPGYDTGSIETEKLSLVLYGATNKTLAAEYAQFLLNCNYYLVKTVEFEVGVDALASNVGDVIWVSHDVPDWDESGRVVSATSNTLTIDHEVTLLAGVSYQVGIRHQADDTFESKDVTVQGVDTTTATLPLTSSWSTIPSAEDIFALATVSDPVKKFSIVSITRTQEMQRRITAIEYDSTVYSDSVSIPDYEDDYDQPDVTGLVARETYRLEGGITISYVNLIWRGFGLFTIFQKEATAGQWTILGTTHNLFYEVKGLEPGHTYYFAVSATSNPGDGETVMLTFKGWTAPLTIWPVTGLEICGQGNDTVWAGKDLKLCWSLGTNAFPDAGEEAYGAGTFPPMTEFGGYYIEICNVNSVVLRTITQIENTFTYTYEMNSEDTDGDPLPNLLIKVWAQDLVGHRSAIPATLTVINPAPAAVSGLTAIPYMGAVQFRWRQNSETDLWSYTYRLKVETDAWSDWVTITSNEVSRILTESEKSAHGANAVVYIEIKAKDSFGNESSVATANGTAEGLNIGSTDIEDFGIDASKIFFKIPVITGDSWSDDSPSANYVSWNTHTLYYDGAEYSIAAGNTNLKYIYWDGSSSSYSTTDTNPTLTDGQFIIAVNINGTHDLAWNAIANQVIGSAYIEDAAIVSAKIANASIGNAKITDLDATKITSGYLSSDRIEAGSISLVAKASDFQLSSILGDLDDIANGSNYGKVALTAISAGKILLTSGAGVTGGLPKENSELYDHWKQAGTTYIAGGMIYTNTIYLNRLIGSSGNLTISGTGQLIIDTDEGMLIKSGDATDTGSLVFECDTNYPGKIIFKGSSYSTEFGGWSGDGSSIVFDPQTTNVISLAFGRSASYAWLSDIVGYTGEIGTAFKAEDSSGNYCAFGNSAYAAGPCFTLHLNRGGTNRYIEFRYTSTYIGFYPTSADTIYLGVEAYPWSLLYVNQVLLKEVAAGSNATDYGTLFTKSDNKLYFIDGDGTTHEVAFV